MTSPAPLPDAVVGFLKDEVFSVPQLEVLLLVHAGGESARSVEQIAQEFYLPASAFEPWLAALAERGLVVAAGGGYAALPVDAARSRLLDEVADWYSRRRVTVTRQVYEAKEDPARRFADAFRLRKDRKP